MAEQQPGPTARATRWVPLRTAPDQLTAELWRGLLASDGIPSTLAPGDVASYLGVSLIPCRLLVPEELLLAARSALETELGPELSQDDERA
jgi:hypothetical protein